jgi:ubiquinone/menaquinone biosynthesis C-methylase UbiE
MQKDPSQFYTDLVAELYEPLAGGLPEVEPYQRFVDRYGTPALELGCGSGLPMLDLIDLCYEIEGLDASADMLEVCLKKASQRGHKPNLYLARFQDFELSKQFKSIYIASASFTLLTDDQDARQTLDCIWRHLTPGGAVFIPLEVLDGDRLKRGINQFKSKLDEMGRTISVGMTGIEISDDGRDVVMHLRYEREQEDGTLLRLNRDWHRRSWNEDQILTLMSEAGFDEIKILSAQPNDDLKSEFAVLGQKPI